MKTIFVLSLCVDASCATAEEVEVKFNLFKSAGDELVMTRENHKGNYANYLLQRIKKNGPISHDVRAKVSVAEGVKFGELMGMFKLFDAAGVKKFEIMGSYLEKSFTFKVEYPLEFKSWVRSDKGALGHLIGVSKEQQLAGNFSKSQVSKTSMQFRELSVVDFQMSLKGVKKKAKLFGQFRVKAHVDVPAAYLVRLCSVAAPVADGYKFAILGKDEKIDDEVKIKGAKPSADLSIPKLNKATKSKIEGF